MLHRGPTLLLAAALAFGTGLASASDTEHLPSLGDAGGGSLSLGDEYQMGLQIVREMRRANALLDDPLLTDYLQDLGHRLSSHSDNPELPFQFFAVKERSVNAFALPGGFIGVHAGLLLMTEDEDELAGVLAHEVAHVTQRHVARYVEASTGMSLRNLAMLLGAIAIASSNAGPDATQAALMGAQAASIQQQLNFTRANEYEADRIGIQTLADAGHDPRGMISFFEKMGRASAWVEARRPEMLSTHPVSASRLNEARSRARTLEVAARATSRLYPLMVARTRVLTTQEPRDAVAWFEARDGKSVADRYGLATAQLRAGKPELARPLLAALVKEDPSQVAFQVALAEAQAQDGDQAAAGATYERAVRVFPTSTALALSYADWLVVQGQPARAHETMVQLLLRVPAEPRHYRLLAIAADRAGSPGDARYYAGEQYLLDGDLFGAIDQLKQALAVPGISDFQRARYQASLDRLLGYVATMSRQQRSMVERGR
jgi:predicted Zn-dependent protease